jgi:hypothetical protein
MTKVVINRCYGGFGLSPFGIEKYLEQKGKQAYWYHRYIYTFTKIDTPNYISDCFTKDYGESMTTYDSEDYFYDHDIPRDDPDLVYIIETYGSDKISSEFADDINYEISDSYGNECIDQSWC